MNFSRPYLLVVLATMLALITTSCDVDDICAPGEGSVEEQGLTIPTFTGIDLRIDGRVFLTQGAEQTVTVFGQPNMIDKLKLEVDDLTWRIDFQGCTRNYEPLDIYITLPELDYVRLSGSGDISSETRFTVDDVDLLLSGSGNLNLGLDADFIFTKISGSGDIILDLEATQLQSEISASGNLTYTGTTPTHLAEIRGSGNISAFDLLTNRTDIRISGSGNAEVTAEESLDVNITGGGNVRYKGSPSLSVQVSGSGKVVDAN